jgi:hypothetical protein
VEKNLSAVHRLTEDSNEKDVGTLKFHNLELYLSLNENIIDPQRVSVALKNLKDSISIIEESITFEKPKAEIIQLHPEKKKKCYSSEHYFSAKNHLDLFNIGNFYFQEFKKGKKNFALYADKDEMNSHDTLLGLASYFNYHESVKATIIIENFATSSIAKHFKNTQRELRNYDSIELEVLNTDGIDIIEFSSLRHLCKKLDREGFENLIEKIFLITEISFWDFPNLKNLDDDKELYFPLIQKINSFSVLLSRGKSKSSHLKNFLSYAKKYNMKVDGVLFDKGPKE